MLDDPPRGPLDPRRHRQHARAHRRHLRAIVERVDRAQQRAAEGRTGRSKRAVGIDVELGAVGSEPGEQRGRHRTGEVAAERRRAEEQDFRLVGVDELGQHLRVGFVAIVGEHVGTGEVGEVGAVAEGFRGDAPRPLAVRTYHHRRDLDAELCGEPAADAHQLPRHRMDLAAFLLDEHPDVLVGLEPLGQLLLGRGAFRGSCRFAHRRILKIRSPTRPARIRARAGA
jgi:hypothetical protein